MPKNDQLRAAHVAGKMLKTSICVDYGASNRQFVLRACFVPLQTLQKHAQNSHHVVKNVAFLHNGKATICNGKSLQRKFAHFRPIRHQNSAHVCKKMRQNYTPNTQNRTQVHRTCTLHSQEKTPRTCANNKKKMHHLGASLCLKNLLIFLRLCILCIQRLLLFRLQM